MDNFHKSARREEDKVARVSFIVVQITLGEIIGLIKGKNNKGMQNSFWIANSLMRVHMCSLMFFRATKTSRRGVGAKEKRATRPCYYSFGDGGPGFCV